MLINRVCFVFQLGAQGTKYGTIAHDTSHLSLAVTVFVPRLSSDRSEGSMRPSRVGVTPFQQGPGKLNPQPNIIADTTYYKNKVLRTANVHKPHL